MKKKLCVMALAFCLATSMAACGSTSSDSSSTAGSTAKDAGVTKDTRIVSVKDLDKYVTLGDYKGLELQKSVDTIDDATVESQIQTNLQGAAEEITEADATAQMGDIANIDYVGKMDGTEFDGGSATDYDLELGSESFITGFEEGVVGMKKGETKDINLTFPEDYYSSDLAGKAVVFTVTLNKISRVPELTDDWVKNNSDYDTIDAYKASVKEQLQADSAEASESSLWSTALSDVIEAATVSEYPQDDIDTAVAAYTEYVQSYADQSGVELAEFIEQQGMTQDQFDEQAKTQAEYTVKQNLVVQAIMDKEGLSLADKDCDSIRADFVSNYGVEDIAELNDTYGAESVNQAVAANYVGNFIVKNATVTEVNASTETTEATTDVTPEDSSATDENAEAAPTEETETAEDAPVEEAQ